jgi:exodeoxyribonuclease VII small subunit
VKYLTRNAAHGNADAMNNSDAKTDQTLNFEDALKALEIIVHKLESGEAPLDESIALYERGHALRALCQTRLDAAKARIEAITLGSDGAASGTKSFDAD